MPDPPATPESAHVPADDSAPGRWGVFRQDDNGNEFLVRAFDSREAAEAACAACAAFAALPHKQHYWVARIVP